MPENRRATRLPSSSEARPVWVRALDTFYGPSFDARSRKELAESMADFLELPPGEQTFHQAHLAFRQVQALADVHASLRRIEGMLGGLDLSALATLKHLAPMRRALDDIADAQADFLDAAEEAADGEEGEDGDVLDDDLPPEDDGDLIDDELPAEADTPGDSTAAVAPPEEPEVVVPEIVEPPPAADPQAKKPRRARVIDVPAEAA